MARKPGTSTRLKAVQAAIAAGKPPLQAFADQGYAYPEREVKRRATLVAEARNVDPLSICVDVMKYGDVANKISAARAVLATPENRAAESAGATIVYITIVTPDGFTVAGGAYHTCERDVPAGATIYDEVDVAVEAVVEAANRPSAPKGGVTPHQLARATLNSILSGALKCTDAALVAAAGVMLRDHPPATVEKRDTARVVAVVFNNGGGPGPCDATYVRARAEDLRPDSHAEAA